MIHLTRALDPPLARRAACTSTTRRNGPRRRSRSACSSGSRRFSACTRSSAVALAFLLNLNRVAVLLGVYSNLPWIIGAYYASTTMIGAAMLGTRLPPGFGDRLAELFELSVFEGEFWRELGGVLMPLFWPFIVGSTLGAIVLAMAAYPLALAFVTSRKRLRTSSTTNNEVSIADLTLETAAGEPRRLQSLSVMIIAGSFWRKVIVTTVAAGGFVSLYEVTILDSKDGGPERGREHAMPPPAPGARLAFTRHGLLQGADDGVGRGGAGAAIAASDPVAAAGRLGRRDRRRTIAKYDGIYTILDTGPAVQGPRDRHLHVELLRGAGVRPQPVRLTVLRLGWNPRATTPSFMDRLFRRPNARADQPLAAVPAAAGSAQLSGPTGPGNRSVIGRPTDRSSTSVVTLTRLPVTVLSLSSAARSCTAARTA